jgi:hypothetical protein
MPEFTVRKFLLDSVHDAMIIYEYCRRSSITLFIDLNIKRGIKVPYKNDFTTREDGVPICIDGLKMRLTDVNEKMPSEIPLPYALQKI